MFGYKKIALLLVLTGATVGTGCYGTYHGSTQGHGHAHATSPGTDYCPARLPAAQREIETMYTRIDGRRSAYMQQRVTSRDGVRYTVEVATDGTGDIARHSVKTGLSDIVVDCGRDGTSHNCFVDIYLDGDEVASMGPTTEGQIPIRCVPAGDRRLVIEHAGGVVYDATVVFDSDTEYEIDIIEASPGDFRVNVHTGDRLADRMPPIPGGDRARAERGDHDHDRDHSDRRDRRDHDRRDRADRGRDNRDDRANRGRDNRDDRADRGRDNRDDRDDRADRGRDNRDDRANRGRDNRDDRADRGRDNRDDRADRGRDNRDDRADRGRDNRDDRADRGRDNRRDSRSRGRGNNDASDVKKRGDVADNVDLGRGNRDDRAERETGRTRRGVDNREPESVDTSKKTTRTRRGVDNREPESVDTSKKTTRTRRRVDTREPESVDTSKKTGRTRRGVDNREPESVDTSKKTARTRRRVDTREPESVDTSKKTPRTRRRVDTREPESVDTSGSGRDTKSMPSRARSVNTGSAMSGSEFRELLERVRRESRQKLRHAIIRDAVRRNYFTSKQSAKLVAELSKSTYKTNAAEQLYAKVVDKKNFGIVLDEFSRARDRRKVERAINWDS